jgi:hypothetical protein
MISNERFFTITSTPALNHPLTSNFGTNFKETIRLLASVFCQRSAH